MWNWLEKLLGKRCAKCGLRLEAIYDGHVSPDAMPMLYEVPDDGRPLLVCGRCITVWAEERAQKRIRNGELDDLFCACNTTTVSYRDFVDQVWAKAASDALEQVGIAAMTAALAYSKTEPDDRFVRSFIRKFQPRKLKATKSKELAKQNLSRADFRDTDLSRANLQEASLEYADFRGANLEGATLEKANLGGASFRGADLRKANLRESNIQDADFRDADVGGAIFAYAQCNDVTQWPEDFVPIAAGVTPLHLRPFCDQAGWRWKNWRRKR